MEFGESAERCGALVVLGTKRDARDAARTLRDAGVCACVLRVSAPGSHRAAAVTPLPARPLLVAVRGAHRSVVARTPHVALAPPLCAPCDLRAGAACHPPCPFEPARYPTLASERALAFWPRAEDLLVNFWLSDSEASSLAVRTMEAGAEAAAAEFLQAHGARLLRTRPRELRVGALLPSRAAAHTYSAAALEAAVVLADADADSDSAADASFRFKTDACAAGCSAPAAFKYVTDALAHEYASVSALAGPACGAALRSVVGVANVTRLPVLAYTAAAAAPGGALLAAAGSAREALAPLAALCRHYDWRRVALLTEPAAGRALSSADLELDIVARLDLPDTDDWNFQLFEKVST